MASCIRASGAAPEPISVERARPRERLPRDAAGGLAALLQVLLVVVLGSVEGGRRDDLGDDRAAESPLALQLPLRGQGRRLLLGIVKEDRRAVLRADIPALAIRGRGIVILPEDPPLVLRVRGGGRAGGLLARLVVEGRGGGSVGALGARGMLGRGSGVLPEVPRRLRAGAAVGAVPRLLRRGMAGAAGTDVLIGGVLH